MHGNPGMSAAQCTAARLQRAAVTTAGRLALGKGDQNAQRRRHEMGDLTKTWGRIVARRRHAIKGAIAAEPRSVESPSVSVTRIQQPPIVGVGTYIRNNGRPMSDPIQASTLLVDRVLREPTLRVHFVGVGGAGMSALAHLRAMTGGATSGSDRSFDRSSGSDEQLRCESLGVRIHPQDGSGVDGADLVVVSTAVEPTIADVARAIDRGVPIAHRSELLAGHVRARRTIAVTGTSGKSTVTAMIFEALRGAGLDPAVITGGELRALQDGGHRGNCWPGRGPLVIEADESDKSLIHYWPAVGVILNLQRDHDEPEAIAPVFHRFRRQISEACVLGEDQNLDELRPDAVTFGFGERCEWQATRLDLRQDECRFVVRGLDVRLPIPGRHNVLNALAALAACHAVGADLPACASTLATFRGVARRFEVVGRPRGIDVIDDFAHNPAKVAAAIATAQLRSERVLAFFQPHGFGPTRFMRRDLVQAFATGLRAADHVFLGEIFYAGGTATKDISSRDLCDDVTRLGANASYLARREDWLPILRRDARPGDCVLVMGARDPSLASFTRAIAAALATP